MVIECVREAAPHLDEWTLTAGNPLVQCLVEEFLWYQERRAERAAKIAACDKLVADARAKYEANRKAKQ